MNKKLIPIAIIVIAILFSASGGLLAMQGPEWFQWKNRLVLISAKSSQDVNYRRQKDLFNGEEEGLQDRDVIVLFLFDTSPSKIDNRELSFSDSQKFREKFNLEVETFDLVLIGKDGTVKLRSPKPIEPSRIFGLIDSMPMRRSEMRQKANSKP